MLHHAGHDSLLDVKPVFCLLEDGVGMLFKNIFGDLLAAVGGQAVKDDVPGGGLPEKLRVDLVGTEGRFLFGLAFLAHGKPDIGVDDVGTCDGMLWIGRDSDVGATEFGEEFGRRLILGGGGENELEAEMLGCPAPGARHVAVAIADEGDLFSVPAPEFFADGEKVGENLTGVFVIGESIDGRDARVGCKVFPRPSAGRCE